LPTCFGEDFGRLGDMTVIWPMQIASDLTRRTPFAVELRNIPFRQQEQILFYIVDRLPRFLGGAMDARGNGQYLAETARQRYGSRIAQVMLSLEWYREQMPRFKAAFEDGAITIPKDADILLDHRAIVVENGVAHVGDRRLRGSDNKSRHGDCAIAAALAYFASRQDFSEIDYRPVSRNESVARDPFGAPPEEDSIGSRNPRARFGAGAW
jgi:phage FluMu gp28-like protein